MRFSFWVGNGNSWDHTLAECQHAEQTGWDGLWIADHFMPMEGDGDMQEAWTMLAAIAAAVPRVRIGPLVVGNTYRNPAVLAKTATTVDQISGGRVVLGVGAGWQENEHTAYGIEFNSFGWRFDRLEEALQIMKGLMADEKTNFAGDHYTMVDAPMNPKPVNGAMPILIGGTGKKRTLNLVARFADEWNAWAEPQDMIDLGAVLDQHCADVGRDPAEISRTAVALLFLSNDEEQLAKWADLDAGRATIKGSVEQVIDTIGQYRDAGTHEIIIPDFTLGKPERRNDTMDLFINEIAPAFR